MPDVDQFPGHIACSSLSKSEIVVPLIAKGETQLVLDVDSDRLNDFDAADQKYLEAIVELIRNQNFTSRPSVIPQKQAQEVGICKGQILNLPLVRIRPIF